MSRQIDQTKTLLEAWEAVTRYRWRFILAMFGVTSGVLAGSFLLPRKYKAEAVFERRTDMVLTEIMDHGASKSFLDSQRSSLVEDIGGQIAVDEMIETLKNSPKTSYLVKSKNITDLQNLRADLSRRVTVRFDIGTKEFDRIRVSFMHHDRHLASAVVNTLVGNYIKRTRKLIDGRLQRTAGFFESEVSHNRVLIEKLENQKLTFEIDHAELLPNSPGSIQVRLKEVQQELGGLKQQRDATVIRIEALRGLIKDTPKITPRVVTSRNPQLDALEARLASLKSQLEEYTGTYKMTDRHPDLLDLRKTIAVLEREIENTPEEIITQKHLMANRQREDMEMQLNQDITALQAMDNQIESFKEMIARYNLHSSQLFPVRSDYRKLSRHIEHAQRQLAFWEENFRRVQMALTAETGHRGVRLDLVKPSENITKPVSPNLVQILMAAVILGVATGGVNVFIAYRTDESCTDGETLADTCNLPLMGTVSEIISRKQQMERRVRNLILYPLNTSAMAAVLVMMVGLLYLNLEKPQLWEQLKNNPTSLLRQGSDQSADADITTGKE